MKLDEKMEKRLIPLADCLYNAIIEGNIEKVIGISGTINIIIKQYQDDLKCKNTNQ